MSFITDSQVETLRLMCGRCNPAIDMTKFVNMGKRRYDSIGQIPEDTAAKMIQKLQDYQRKVEPVPDSIKEVK